MREHLGFLRTSSMVVKVAAWVFLFLGSGIFILLNAYYVFPLFSFAKNSYDSLLAGSGGVEGISDWIDVISKNASMINVFRLQGIPDWYGNNVHIYANIFLNNPLLISSVCIGITVVRPSGCLKKT